MPLNSTVVFEMVGGQGWVEHMRTYLRLSSMPCHFDLVGALVRHALCCTGRDVPGVSYLACRTGRIVPGVSYRACLFSFIVGALVRHALSYRACRTGHVVPGVSHRACRTGRVVPGVCLFQNYNSLRLYRIFLRRKLHIYKVLFGCTSSLS